MRAGSGQAGSQGCWEGLGAGLEIAQSGYPRLSVFVPSISTPASAPPPPQWFSNSAYFLWGRKEGAGPGSHLLCFHVGLNFWRYWTPLCLEINRDNRTGQGRTPSSIYFTARLWAMQGMRKDRAPLEFWQRWWGREERKMDQFKVNPSSRIFK